MTPLPPACVQFSNVTLALGGAKRLHGLTHTLPAAGITALVGANGAGKSLLLKALHGIVPLSNGKVRWAKPYARERRALMRQHPAFLRRSVQENLVYALRVQGWSRRAAQVRAQETLTWLHLDDQAQRPAPHLSPGLQARLAMARALAIEPGVLLLDEPTASLDPESTLALEELICFASDQGTKVILVSHALGQVRRLAANVLMLDRGQSVFFGPVEQFFTDPQHPKALALLHAAGFCDRQPYGQEVSL